MASAALTVSISGLASSIIALMPRWMVWGIECFLLSRTRCGILHAAPQSRDRYERRRLVRPRLCSAPLRKSYALRCVRGTKTLPHQFLHRAFQPLDRDRIHALRKQPADDGGGLRIIPVPLRHRVEPHRMRIGPGDALEPDRS